VTIYLHVAPSADRHRCSNVKNFQTRIKKFCKRSRVGIWKSDSGHLYPLDYYVRRRRPARPLPLPLVSRTRRQLIVLAFLEKSGSAYERIDQENIFSRDFAALRKINTIYSICLV